MSSKRLTKDDIDKRAVIKLNRHIKSIDEGVNGIMTFGEDNDYPQVMELAILGSVTAKAAAGIYSKFLSGDGFEVEAINNIIVGRDQRGKEITVRSLLRQCSDSASFFNGAYVHCNKNLNGETGTVHMKAFKNGRFSKPDDTGFSAKILFYNNWNKDKDIGNYKWNDAVSYSMFSNNPDVTKAQIEKAGGIDKYKGQIYFLAFDNAYFYPLSPFDAAYMDVDTEQQISLYRNRQVRNGFFDKVIIRKQKEYKDIPITSINGDNDDPRLERVQDDTVANDLVDFVGADGESVIVVEDDVDTETGEFPKNSFQVEKIEGNVNDKIFENWDKTLKNNIRMSIRGIPAVLIDYEQGALGTTSGEAIVQATNFYNAVTKDDRQLISEAFAEIFKKSSIPELRNNTNWKIKPLKLVEDGTTIEPGTAASN